MESKNSERWIIYLGYILLLIIPIVQNDFRYYYSDKCQICKIILGSLPNLLATFSICSMGLLFNEKIKRILHEKLFILLTLIIIFYEFFQVRLKNLFFDYYDILFSIIGYIIFIILKNKISKSR
jgi:hypothetical protein